MRILDCFPYFDEVQILKLRLELLYDYVDKFIISEANYTFKGDYKGFNLKNQLNEFGICLDKIIIIEENVPSYSEEISPWVRERMQRNAAARFIHHDDVAIISDCDEIINPDLVHYYVSVAKKNPNSILRIPMDFLMARADLRVYDVFGKPMHPASAFICMKNHLKYTLSDIREAHSMGQIPGEEIDFESMFITEDGENMIAGWHFSWMGGMERMKKKCSSFSHWNEVNIVENYEASENNTDPLGRSNHILKKYPLTELPTKILEEDYYRSFFLPCS